MKHPAFKFLNKQTLTQAAKDITLEVKISRRGFVQAKWAWILFLSVLLVGLAMQSIKVSEAGQCDGRQWSHPSEEIKCRFPTPPIGRWKAVYTQDFARDHNLPLENVSTELSPGVDYMEMDVQPYQADRVGCFVNMLIKKPNDVAVFNAWGKTEEWGPGFNAHRKLAHFVNLDTHKKQLNEIHTFSLEPRNAKYDPKKSYGIGGTTAFYAGSIFEGYDYITADVDCYNILSDPSRFPDKWALEYAKASVWGRNERKYKYSLDPSAPQGEDYFNSRKSMNIPSELITAIFEDMPIGGRR